MSTFQVSGARSSDKLHGKNNLPQTGPRPGSALAPSHLRPRSTRPNHGETVLQIAVTDEATAEDVLLRLVLANRQSKVTEFGRKKHDLEEVFMQAVEGGQAS